MAGVRKIAAGLLAGIGAGYTAQGVIEREKRMQELEDQRRRDERKFRSGERKAGQTFRSGERKAGQTFRSGELAAVRRQSEADQLRTEERADVKWGVEQATTQSERDRAFKLKGREVEIKELKARGDAREHTSVDLKRIHEIAKDWASVPNHLFPSGFDFNQDVYDSGVESLGAEQLSSRNRPRGLEPTGAPQPGAPQPGAPQPGAPQQGATGTDRQKRRFNIKKAKAYLLAHPHDQIARQFFDKHTAQGSAVAFLNEQGISTQ